jgi:hypothetical protein
MNDLPALRRSQEGDNGARLARARSDKYCTTGHREHNGSAVCGFACAVIAFTARHRSLGKPEWSAIRQHRRVSFLRLARKLSDDRQYAPATLRNRDFILDRLRDALPRNGVILEIASGSGEHIVHFARHFGALVFQPSGPQSDALLSVAAWVKATRVTNVRKPKFRLGRSSRSGAVPGGAVGKPSNDEILKEIRGGATSRPTAVTTVARPTSSASMKTKNEQILETLRTPTRPAPVGPTSQSAASYQRPTQGYPRPTQSLLSRSLSA